MPGWTFRKAPKGIWQTLRALLGPGVFEYMAHLERLEGCEISRFHYVPSTDELEVTARYAGHDLRVWDLEGDLVMAAADDVPVDVFQRACDHLKSYRPVSRADVERAKERYARIAKASSELKSGSDPDF